MSLSHRRGRDEFAGSRTPSSLHSEPRLYRPALGINADANSYVSSTLLPRKEICFCRKPRSNRTLWPRTAEIADERFDVGRDLANPGGVAHHGVVDSRHASDEFRDVPPGVDQGRPLGLDATAVESNGPNLGDRVTIRVKTRGFNVYRNDGIH